MRQIYYYPKIKLKENEVQNSYLNDFEKAIAVHHEVVNKKTTTKGVLDLFKHFFNTEVYLFNWIEDLPRRKMGKIQVFFFVFFLVLVKLTGKKIMWVLHNKYSHNTSKNRWTNFMFKTMMRNSNLILTHSNEGIVFAKKKYPKYAHKIKYEIHPIKEKLDFTSKEKKFDFLFWGSIQPYKNIVNFLEFVKNSTTISSPKILIVGRCFNKEYAKLLHASLSADMVFENKFYEMDEIASFAAQSKYVLFTYSAESVLSSGALMDSIRMNTQIIGPNLGAFKDLSFLPTVHVYNTYQDIISIYSENKKEIEPNNNVLEAFFKDNSWRQFANKIQRHIKLLF